MNLPRVSVVRVDLAQLVKNKIDIMTIAELHKLFLNSGKITTDSRDIPAGSIFFALKGDNFDGNNFVLDALGKGAAFAVADDASLEGKDERIIITKDVLKTLQDLARFHRESLSIPVVGLTGTNGKTTIASLLYQLFKKAGFKVGLLSTVKILVDDIEYKATHTTPDSVTINQYLAEMVEIVAAL